MIGWAMPSGLFYVARAALAAHGATRLDARTAAPAPIPIDEAKEMARRDQPGVVRIARRMRRRLASK